MKLRQWPNLPWISCTASLTRTLTSGLTVSWEGPSGTCQPHRLRSASGSSSMARLTPVRSRTWTRCWTTQKSCAWWTERSSTWASGWTLSSSYLIWTRRPQVWPQLESYYFFSSFWWWLFESSSVESTFDLTSCDAGKGTMQQFYKWMGFRKYPESRVRVWIGIQTRTNSFRIQNKVNQVDNLEQRHLS